MEDKHFQKPPKTVVFPGPGAYNLRIEPGIEKDKFLPFKVQKVRQPQLISPKKELKDKIENGKNYFYEVISDFDIPAKACSTANFVSKSPRFDKAPKIKKIPGPAFYRPTTLPKKLSYNYNMEKNWV